MPKRLILVTTDWAPFSGKLRRICEEEAGKARVEFEVRKDDWTFLSKYGEKDELGGTDVPQVFVEEEGRITHVLTKVPLDERGRPDFEEARRRIAGALSA